MNISNIAYEKKAGIHMSLDSDKPTSNTLDEKLKKIPFSGILLVFISTAFLAFATVLVKLVSEKHNLSASKALSSGVVLLLILEFFLLYFVDDCFVSPKGEHLYLVLRTICGATSFHTIMLSVTYMALGDSTAITQSAPIYVSLINWIIFRDKCKFLTVFVTVLNVIGLVFLSRTEFIFPAPKETKQKSKNSSQEILIGFILAMSAAVTMAFTMVFMEKLKRTPTNTSIFWWAACICTIGVVLEFINGEQKIPRGSIPYILGIALCMVVAQQSQTIGFRLENSGILAIVRSSQVLFGYILQVSIFGEPLDGIKSVGAVIIVISIIIIGVDKYLAIRKEKRKARIEVKSVPNKVVVTKNTLRSQSGK